MLRLIYGTFGSGKTRGVYSDIKKLVDKKSKTEKSVYLIVPEQDTVRAESEALGIVGSEACLAFEVQNFSRLADSVFRALGGVCYNYADGTAKALCMYKALCSLGGLLNEPFDTTDEGRVHKLLSLSAHLRANGITTDDLERASKKLPASDPLSNELSDVALVLGVYESTLEENFRDGEKDLDIMTEKLKGRRFFAGCDIFIDGFCSFTASQMRLIGMFIDECDSVSITIPYDRNGGEYSYSREAKETERRLVSLAAEMGVSVERCDAEGGRRSEFSDINYLCSDLCKKHAAAYEGEVTHVGVYECADAYEEAEAACAYILKKVREGARFSDIAIVMRSPEEYAGILDHAFEKHGIPCFFSTETKAEAHHLIKLVYASLSICFSRWRREDVIGYLKTDLCGIGEDDSGIFEKYVNTWRISGERFCDGVDFTRSPAGYTDRKSEKYDAVLARVNAVKKKLTDDMTEFYSSVNKKDATVSDVCTALWAHLERLRVSEQLKEEARALAQMRQVRGAKESEGIYKCLCQALDSLYRILGEEKVSAYEFYVLLRMCLKTKTVSVIPTSSDAVTVGNASMLRVGKAAHTLILGACDGSFPISVRDNGFFDYPKRKKLSVVGLNIEYDTELEVSKELFYFCRAVCSASESVYISYPRRDASGGAAKISSSVASLMKQLKIEKVTDASLVSYDTRLFDESSVDEVFLTETDLSGESVVWRAAAEDVIAARALAPYELQSELSLETRREIFKDRLGLTQARLESYTRCHFAYLCKYILALDENRKYSFDSSDIGNFVHSVLDTLTQKMSRDGVFSADISESELDAGIDDAISDYISRVCPEDSMQSARLMGLFGRIRRSVSIMAENLCSEFAQSRFTVAGHELSISKSDPTHPSPLEFTLEDGSVLSIFGILDRADVFRDGDELYVRVVDYKTGPKTFSMDDIKSGLNLQLLLYLFTMCAQKGEEFKKTLGADKETKILPAGILYYAAKVGDCELDAPLETEAVKEQAKLGLKRNGVLLNDMRVLTAMEPSLSGNYIPVKAKDGGELTKPSLDKLVSLDTFSRMYEDVSAVIISTANDLRAGKVDAVPLEHNGAVDCRFCSMKNICRITKVTTAETEDEDGGEG